MIFRIFLLIFMLFNVVNRMAGEVLAIFSLLFSLMFNSGYGIVGFISCCIGIVIYILVLKYYIRFIYYTLRSYDNMSVIGLAIFNMFALKRIEIIIIISAGLLLVDNIIRSKKKKFNTNDEEFNINNEEFNINDEEFDI